MKAPLKQIQLQPIKNLEGSLKGMDTSNIREKKDRKIDFKYSPGNKIFSARFLIFLAKT